MTKEVDHIHYLYTEHGGGTTMCFKGETCRFNPTDPGWKVVKCE